MDELRILDELLKENQNYQLAKLSFETYDCTKLRNLAMELSKNHEDLFPEKITSETSDDDLSRILGGFMQKMLKL